MSVADFGWFEKGGAVRRATTPANAVKLRAQGWRPTDRPADAEPVAAPEPAPVVSLDLDTPAVEDHVDHEEDES